jgi:hypothetical protein
MYAEAPYGVSPTAKTWAEKQGKILKTKRNEAVRVIQAARAERRSRGLKRDRRELEAAISCLWKYREHMTYAKYRRTDLPHGSGVAEAACETIFAQRLESSGMR